MTVCTVVKSEDFAKFCGLLRIYELYQILSGFFDEIFTIMDWFHFTLITITMEANGGNVTAAHTACMAYTAGMAYNGGAAAEAAAAAAEAALALQD